MRKLAIAPLVAAAVLVLVLGTCFHQYGDIDAPAAKIGSDLVRLSEGAGGAKASRVAYDADTGNDGKFETGDKITVVISDTGNGNNAGSYLFVKTLGGEFTPDAGVPQYWNDFGGSFGAYAYYPAGAEYVDLRDQSTLKKHVEAGYLFAEKQTGINKGNYNNDKKFTFKHKTARVKVTLEKKADSAIAADINTAVVTFYGYTFGMPNPGGNGAITPIVSVPTGGAQPVTATTPDGEITPFQDGNTYTAMMIPAEYTNSDASVNTFLEVELGGETYTYKPASLTLEAGKSYTLNLTVKDKELEEDDDVDMVFLEGGTIGPTTSTGSFSDDGFSDGAFPTGRTVTLSPFYIAKYETTYKLWKVVYDWAVVNGYTFAYPGTEGHGTTGTGNESLGWTPEEKRLRPVTSVSWRDVIVWCNAYSKKRNLDPVYYYNGNEIMTAVNNNAAFTNAVCDLTKNGYRLPTDAEWEYAARGGDTSDVEWSYKYAGTNAGELGDYAWYTVNSKNLGSSHKDYGAHPVGTKKPNKAGLYDMSGNVYEWCWDWYAAKISESETIPDPKGPGSGNGRVLRGGSWDKPDGGRDQVRSAWRDMAEVTLKANNVGFRVLRSE